ncbi:MAG: amidase [Acidobacteriota bacterium]
MAVVEEIAFLSATETLDLIRRGDVSPVDVVETCLAQVDKWNGQLNALCTLSDRALEEAREAERIVRAGGEAGPLQGLPVGIKDVTPTAGLRTTFGSTLYADFVPSEDALVVSRLKAAGAIVLGKTNTPEFTAGGNTFNELFGATRNPWDSRLSAGGSTGGGGAALAAGMITLAEGTDLGGSLRIPASFCGVVGLRPSVGLVPIHPTEFLWDNLQVSGPMARTAEDVALMLQVMSGPSRLSPLCQPSHSRDFPAAVRAGIPQGLRLAYSPDIAGIGIDDGLEGVCRGAAWEMAQVGACLREVELDLSFGRKAFLALRGLWMVVHQFRHLDQLDRLGANLSGNVRAGLRITTRDLAAAEQVRGRIWHLFRDFFQRFDLLLTPCMAVPPFPVEQNYPERIGDKKMETYVDWFASTFTLSLTGLPVASVPCGLDQRGLPVGLQILGPAQGEEAVLALAREIQQARPIGSPPLQ